MSPTYPTVAACAAIVAIIGHMALRHHLRMSLMQWIAIAAFRMARLIFSFADALDHSIKRYRETKAASEISLACDPAWREAE